MKKKLSTQPYKGTRDFYPEDMAIQRYIFDTWSEAAEKFGYACFNSSILEPSELYKSKGAENEELVNEQTYSFTDRGGRDVTLRPEMTPTTARMAAARQRDLSVPIRWYSLSNVFRYERPQRGRLREHWQLNCDLFGIDDISADIEVLSLAYHVLTAFGATPEMFEVRINNREIMNIWYKSLGIEEKETQAKLIKLNDKKEKMSEGDFKRELRALLGEGFDTDSIIKGLEDKDVSKLSENNPVKQVINGLEKLGITNVVFDRTLARGFDYYTGTVFEIFDKSKKNSRSLLGGGRYDNLTELFGGKALPGIGFGMGDVTMRDFLETHNLLSESIHVTAATLSIIPTDVAINLHAEKVAQQFRDAGTKVSVDISDRRVGKKISAASSSGVKYILTIGSDELKSGNFILKELSTKSETSGTLEELINSIS